MTTTLHPFTLAALRAGLEAAGLPPGEYDIDVTTAEKVAVDGKIFLDRAGALLNGHDVDSTASQWWDVRNDPIPGHYVDTEGLAFLARQSGPCHLYQSPDGIVRHYTQTEQPSLNEFYDQAYRRTINGRR